MVKVRLMEGMLYFGARKVVEGYQVVKGCQVMEGRPMFDGGKLVGGRERGGYA